MSDEMDTEVMLGKQRLAAAKARHKAKLEELRTRDYGLPETAAGRLELLLSVAEAEPRLGEWLRQMHPGLRSMRDEQGGR